MPKTNLNDIFKNGDKFKLKEVDFSSAKIREAIKEVKEEQEKSLKRKEVDWLKLNSFVIKI